MSAQDESGVYYTPSLGFHPDNQHSGYHPQNALKQCSVKGCTSTLSFNDPNRMCGGCRSRHRIYASTKRAKRKLEKAAIASAVVARSGKDHTEEMLSIAQPITWVTTGGQSHQVCYSMALQLSLLETDLFRLRLGPNFFLQFIDIFEFSIYDPEIYLLKNNI